MASNKANKKPVKKAKAKLPKPLRDKEAEKELTQKQKMFCSNSSACSMIKAYQFT